MRIQVIAHCLLNPMVRVGKAVEFEMDVPVIQLPCPETIYFGLKRWEVTKNQLDFPEYHRFCQRLFRPYADMIQLLAEKGAEIEIIGVSKSPSCGAETTSMGYLGGKIASCRHEHVSGKGIFFEIVEQELRQRGVKATFKDVRRS